MKHPIPEVTCGCPRCQRACAVSSCIPTPDEAEALIDAGEAANLALYQRLLAEPIINGDAFVGPRTIGRGAGPHPRREGGPCVFYRDSRCLLHDRGLKPLEGRLACHDRPPDVIANYVLGLWSVEDYQRLRAKLEAANGT